MAAATLVSISALRDLVIGVLETAGVLRDHAEVAADRMIEADVRGFHTHGVFRLAQYVDLIERGGFNLGADVRIERDSPSVALVDGDDALGHVSMTLATTTAAKKALDTGVAWVGVHRGNHAGALAVYVDLLVQQGLAAIVMGVAQANRMPPWGGTEPLLASNPIAFGVPAGEEPPVVFDMATSVAAVGQIRRAAATGNPMPEGWMVDRHGRPLTDPTRMSEGLLLPVGGHKGYGLSMMLGLLAGVMNGASFGRDIVEPASDPQHVSNTGHTVVAVDPGRLRDAPAFATDVDRHVRDFVASTPIDPASPVRVPGSRAVEQRATAETKGLSLDATLLATLDRLGRAAGLDVSL